MYTRTLWWRRILQEGHKIGFRSGAAVVLEQPLLRALFDEITKYVPITRNTITAVRGEISKYCDPSERRRPLRGPETSVFLTRRGFTSPKIISPRDHIIGDVVRIQMLSTLFCWPSVHGKPSSVLEFFQTNYEMYYTVIV